MFDIRSMVDFLNILYQGFPNYSTHTSAAVCKALAPSMWKSDTGIMSNELQHIIVKTKMFSIYHTEIFKCDLGTVNALFLCN